MASRRGPTHHFGCGGGSRAHDSYRRRGVPRLPPARPARVLALALAELVGPTVRGGGEQPGERVACGLHPRRNNYGRRRCLVVPADIFPAVGAAPAHGWWWHEAALPLRSTTRFAKRSMHPRAPVGGGPDLRVCRLASSRVLPTLGPSSPLLTSLYLTARGIGARPNRAAEDRLPAPITRVWKEARRQTRLAVDLPALTQRRARQRACNLSVH